MEAKASAKYLRGSAQKARLVVDMIRGKSVNQALATLRFTNKRAADPVEACVRSAVANATDIAERANIAVDPDDLWVKEIFVDKGPSKGRYRMRPAPQGRAYREHRHFCHISVVVSSDEMPAIKPSNGGASSRRAAQSESRTLKQTRRDGNTANAAGTQKATAADATVTTTNPAANETTPAENA